MKEIMYSLSWSFARNLTFNSDYKHAFRCKIVNTCRLNVSNHLLDFVSLLNFLKTAKKNSLLFSDDTICAVKTNTSFSKEYGQTYMTQCEFSRVVPLLTQLRIFPGESNSICTKRNGSLIVDLINHAVNEYLL
jgi:hypothetical protein